MDYNTVHIMDYNKPNIMDYNKPNIMDYSILYIGADIGVKPQKQTVLSRHPRCRLKATEHQEYI